MSGATAGKGPVKAFRNQTAWERWLERNHGRQDGVWLKLAKKASGIPTVSFEDALEVALCYGWIDSQRLRYDDDHYLQRFTARRPRSRWSKINRERATALMAAGRMKAAGLAEVERAKADGRWDAASANTRK